MKFSVHVGDATELRFSRLVGIGSLCVALFVGAYVDAETTSGKKPNILLIVADDLGYGDVGFQGGKEIPTPFIDSIAKNGVQFTNGYVTCPVCSPTRAGLATGRYQQRFGHEFNPGNVNQQDGTEVGLPLSETTLAQALRDAGYRTAIVGKWHLGADSKREPLARGFDEFYGFLGGAHPYVRTGNKGEIAPIYRNHEQVELPEHLTSEFAKEASEYIRRPSDKPFFLYLTFNAVHNPLQPDAEHLARFEKIADPKRRSYAALLSGLDDAIGKVLASLEESGKVENTVVFFISDNGGPQIGNGSNNSPLTGDKGTVREGGIRVPYLVQWKGTLPSGKKYELPVISLDIPATAAAIAGANLGSADRPVDGVNLVPYLNGQLADAPHESLYWRFGPQHAIRQGDYKLRQQNDQPPQLFNVAADVAETKDLAADKPELVKKLQSDYASWNSQLAEPLWKPARVNGKRAGAAARRAARQKPEGVNESKVDGTTQN